MRKLVLGLLSSIILFTSCTTNDDNYKINHKLNCNVIIDGDLTTRAEFNSVNGQFHKISWENHDKIKLTRNSNESLVYEIGIDQENNINLYGKEEFNWEKENYIVALYPSQNVITNHNYSVNTIQNGIVEQYYTSNPPTYFITDYSNLVLGAYINNVSQSQTFTLTFRPCVRAIDAIFTTNKDVTVKSVTFNFITKIVSGEFYPTQVNDNIRFSEPSYGSYKNGSTTTTVNIPNITLKNGETMRVRAFTFRTSYPKDFKISVNYNTTTATKNVNNNNQIANQTLIEVKLGELP